MIAWIKALGISLKGWLVVGAASFVGLLLVLLRLKDRHIHALEVAMLKQKFANEDEKSDAAVKKAREAYEAAKRNLDK